MKAIGMVLSARGPRQHTYKPDWWFSSNTGTRAEIMIYRSRIYRSWTLRGRDCHPLLGRSEL